MRRAGSVLLTVIAALLALVAAGLAKTSARDARAVGVIRLCGDPAPGRCFNQDVGVEHRTARPPSSSNATLAVSSEDAAGRDRFASWAGMDGYASVDASHGPASRRGRRFPGREGGESPGGVAPRGT